LDFLGSWLRVWVTLQEFDMQNDKKKPVAVVIGATSKWQSDGRNTHLIHGQSLSDTEVPVEARWGIGGALAQKFAREGFFVVMTTRSAANAQALEAAILEQGGDCMITELDLISETSIAKAFVSIRAVTSPAGDRSW
jgi:NAD(P)-dependent dehydrogenase (short-subunit alcohol dehydrogenase family)